jgi:2-methylisocitrate lyase-like PEP mutase family enzyme
VEILEDPQFKVVNVPPADSGVAWLRAHVARFSEGSEHVRRRYAQTLLDSVDVDLLRRPGAPVATLAEALGLDRHVAADVKVIAASYQPHNPVTAEADAAVGRLVGAAGGQWDEPTAARIGLLVQAHDATQAMIAGKTPPLPFTRRLAPNGEEVLVDLSDAPFGAGRHACPGRDHALTLVDGALAFRRLHDGPGPLLLPNAWDVASAAALVKAGFAAVGTTSLGVAAGHGLPDAAGRALVETIDLARRLARLPVPITVDIEAGFGAGLEQLAGELSELGIAGVNIEDGRGTGLANLRDRADLIRTIKQGAPELFVNARVDTYWVGVAHQETLERARCYVDAGADGIFVPGLTDPTEIERLASSLDVPLNVLAQLPIPLLAELGVRRISTGSLLFRASLQAAVDTAIAVRDNVGTPDAFSYEHVQRLVPPEPSPGSGHQAI